MKKDKDVPLLAEEVADFLASCPSREQFLRFRPSARAKKRVRELLQKSEGGRITEDDQWELDQFEYVDMLMQLVKARLRDSKVAQP